MNFNNDGIKKLDRLYRINLINSITGPKSANLIATISSKKVSNLAIFSSVVHLGSDPALIGFFVRPVKNAIRDTYSNIINTRFYTINHINSSIINESHMTSGKFPSDISEFEKCKLNEVYLNNFKAPFVKESYIKFGMELREINDVKSNNSKLIIGSIKEIIIDKNYVDIDGTIDLEKSNSVSVGGVNTYYVLNKVKKLPYIGSKINF